MARRMLGLAKMISWGADSSLSRSKHFINRTKDWLRCEMPMEYHTVARNESHVRMASSIWYATRTILYLFLAYALFSVAFLFKGRSGWHFVTASVALVSLGWFKAKVERTIHYIRVREIIGILCMTEFIKERLKVVVHKEEASDDEMKTEADELIKALEEIKTPVPRWLLDYAKSLSRPSTSGSSAA